VTFIGSFCGVSQTVLGGVVEACVVGNGPTQNVRSSEMPEAQRSRIRCSPRRQSAAILKWLPGVQQKVFTEQRDGLYWAPVQLTGTSQNPKEDLSKRISSALQESVGKELKDQTKDAIKSFLDLLRH